MPLVGAYELSRCSLKEPSAIDGRSNRDELYLLRLGNLHTLFIISLTLLNTRACLVYSKL
jgi:hypothetical protein